MPFCIAAGGLQIDDVPIWLSAGVDAVAIGSTLITSAQPDRPGLDGRDSQRIRSLLSALEPIVDA
jgi:2-dehydro-3-deoxyphosphogluconate aldolase/(4S)-4-hydroxy-2-oxoglutarate aldolase